MADTENILQLGIDAARSGDKAKARDLFRLVTRQEPDNAQGWLWLAGVAENREEKRAALERVVAIEPNNELARKGLAALTGASAGATAASVVTPPAPVETPTYTVADDVDQETGVRQYETPPAEDTPYGATTADDEPYPPPTYDPNDYDVQDYQQEPVGVGVTTEDDEYGAPDIEEDEEPRRRGFAWLPVLLSLLGLVLLLFLVFTFLPILRNGGDDVAGGPDAGLTASPLDGTAYPGTDATGGITGTTNTAYPGASTATAGPVAPAYPVTAPAETTPQTPGETTIAIVPPGEQTAAPPTDQTAITVVPPVDQTIAPPAGQTTIVIVPPATTAAPVDATAPAAPPVEPPAQTTAQPDPAAAPPATTAPPPAAPADVAAANPAVVPNDSLVNAGSWGFTYGGINNIGTGAYGGVEPSRGQYQIVLLAAANNSGQPATIPDGFFVLKDAQGRVYDFNRAASIDYFNRFSGSGDFAADAQFPANGVLASVPLLFDVSPDATNLVLFSRENPNQGFLIR